MSRRGSWLIAGAALALLLLALLFGFSDLDELSRRTQEIRWGWAAAAAAAALASYSSIGGCQRSLLALLGHALPLGVVVRAGFVSTVANRHLRSGGATGFAVLAWLLSRRGVPSGAVLGSTAGFLLMTNAVFGALFVAAVPLAAATVRDQRAPVLALGLVAIGFLASLVLGALAVFHPRLRARWSAQALRFAAWAAARFGRPSWVEKVDALLERFDATATLLFERRNASGPAWAWAVLRIAASLACLWCAVAAAGPRLGLATLLLAFTASKTAGALALVPGGLGLVEGSLVGVLVLFGIEYEAALLAALLNRVLYHLFPACVAVVAFGPLLREARRGSAATRT